MGAEPVVVLYASISVLNWMRAATGSQCKESVWYLEVGYIKPKKYVQKGLIKLIKTDSEDIYNVMKDLYFK